MEGKTVLVSGVGPDLRGEFTGQAQRNTGNNRIGARNEARLGEIAGRLGLFAAQTLGHLDLADAAEVMG